MTTQLPTLKPTNKHFIVVLKSRGNPDFRQDPNRSVPGVPTKRVKAKTLQEASDLVRAYIQENDLGGGNWVGGQVLDGPEQVAQISYNGRAWKPGKYPQPEYALSEPVPQPTSFDCSYCLVRRVEVENGTCETCHNEMGSSRPMFTGDINL